MYTAINSISPSYITYNFYSANHDAKPSEVIECLLLHQHPQFIYVHIYICINISFTLDMYTYILILWYSIDAIAKVTGILALSSQPWRARTIERGSLQAPWLIMIVPLGNGRDTRLSVPFPARAILFLSPSHCLFFYPPFPLDSISSPCPHARLDPHPPAQLLRVSQSHAKQYTEKKNVWRVQTLSIVHGENFFEKVRSEFVLRKILDVLNIRLKLKNYVSSKCL